MQAGPLGRVRGRHRPTGTARVLPLCSSHPEERIIARLFRARIAMVRRLRATAQRAYATAYGEARTIREFQDWLQLAHACETVAWHILQTMED